MRAFIPLTAVVALTLAVPAHATKHKKANAASTASTASTASAASPSDAPPATASPTGAGGSGAAAPDDADVPAPKKHHASIDDDDTAAKPAAEPSEAPAAHPHASHASIDDDVDAAKPKPALDKLRHSFAISGAVDGNTWHYGFTGTTSTSAGSALYPGVSALVDAWPLAFAGVHWLGVDGDIGAGKADVALGSGFSPSEFTADQLHYGANVKMRYTFDNGIGVGPRMGYRFVSAGAADQSVAVGSHQQRTTVAPGTIARALAVGVDGFIPIAIDDMRIELDGRAEILPLTSYTETPDNPGSTSKALGWHALLGARVASSSGIFIEDRVETTGFSATFADAGTRQAVVGSRAVALNGGTAINASASFSLGIGYLF